MGLLHVITSRSSLGGHTPPVPAKPELRASVQGLPLYSHHVHLPKVCKGLLRKPRHHLAVGKKKGTKKIGNPAGGAQERHEKAGNRAEGAADDLSRGSSVF